ncbi:tryptophan transporter [Peptacetobacter sp.]|uniref:tryptophan transporter n=1 Tax=Peptacetobacter sp. TaxID=2991975 RepID=UPI0026095710|nr:tryptophan transporter [Peptacetobacter sp.]
MKTNTYSISNTRKMVLNSILLAIGLILHQITPALALPMQPDFALITMFIVILLNKDDYKSCLLAGIVTGVFTALTTKFPGGQIPNIIDKIISANLGFIFIYLMYKLPFLKKLDEKKLNKINSFILLSVGTFLSGFIFLLSAKYIVGLPAGFNLLLITIVVPSVVINLIVGIILYNIVIRCIK